MYLEQVSLGVSAATQACCQPVLHSNTEQGTNVFCKYQCGTTLKVGHCTHVFRASLLTCFCSNTSLLSACIAKQCRAGKNCILSKRCGTALKVGHCTHVFRASLLRCFCSNTSLLSACIAQKCRAGNTCILSKRCGTALKVGHCTHVFRASLHSCFAATPACCQPVLHSSAEQGKPVFCQNGVALH